MFQYFKKSTKRGAQSLRIGLVSRSAQTRKSLEALATNGSGVSVLQFTDPAKIGKNAADINVFVYDLDDPQQQALTEFDGFMRIQPPSLPVIVLSDTVNDDLVRWFLQLRVADWIKTPFSPGELLAACGRALARSKSTRPDTKCLAFLGARGGVGTSVIAIEAALALANKKTSACLVDLDFLNSPCADYLDLQPLWAIDELIADPSRLDSHMLDAMISRHASGLGVLAAQRPFGSSYDFPEDTITRPLDLALQKFSHLVIDVPRTAEQWAENVLLGATDIFIVTEFTVPGLKSARRMINQIVEKYGDDVKPRVIVNRYQREFFGSNLSSTEAKELLGPFLAGFVSKESKIVGEAINRGIATSQLGRRSSIPREIAKIISEAV